MSGAAQPAVVRELRWPQWVRLALLRSDPSRWRVALRWVAEYEARR